MKKNELLKRILALSLAGVMITSLNGCKKDNKNKDDYNNEFISDINSESLKLSVLVEQHKKSKTIFNERYGYLDLEKKEFYDVINNETIALDEQYFTNYNAFCTDFENLYYYYHFDKDRNLYHFNKGIKLDELKKIESEYFTLNLSEGVAVSRSLLRNNYIDFNEIIYKDDEITIDDKTLVKSGE